MKKVYLVHKGAKGMFTYNKRNAIKIARKNAAKVREMNYWLFHDASSWDIPTFVYQSDKVSF